MAFFLRSMFQQGKGKMHTFWLDGRTVDGPYRPPESPKLLGTKTGTDGSRPVSTRSRYTPVISVSQNGSQQQLSASNYGSLVDGGPRNGSANGAAPSNGDAGRGSQTSVRGGGYDDGEATEKKRSASKTCTIL